MNIMKTISMTGPAPALQKMSEVIYLYAEAAYPRGGSECAQAARSGLTDTAAKISEQLNQNQSPIIISRRIKTHIKAAIQYYLEANSDQKDAEPSSRIMLAILNGETIEDQDWP